MESLGFSVKIDDGDGLTPVFFYDNSGVQPHRALCGSVRFFCSPTHSKGEGPHG